MNRFARALQSKYQARIDEAIATIELYLNNAVGVGEHPDILDVLDRYVSILETNTSKLQALNSILQPPTNNEPKSGNWFFYFLPT